MAFHGWLFHGVDQKEINKKHLVCTVAYTATEKETFGAWSIPISLQHAP